MNRKYYILAIKAPIDPRWSVEFGDYDRKTVSQEMRDVKSSYNFARGTKFKILETDDSQEAIDRAIIDLNAKDAGVR